MKLNRIENSILEFAKKLSEDNQCVLLAYAYDLYNEQKRAQQRESLIHKGKTIAESKDFTVEE